MLHEKDERGRHYHKCKFVASFQEVINAKKLRQLCQNVSKWITSLSVHLVAEKNFGAFFCDLEYTEENLLVSHSYESHVGQPRDVFASHAKIYYNFISHLLAITTGRDSNYLFLAIGGYRSLKLKVNNGREIARLNK